MDFRQWLSELRKLLLDGGYCPTPKDADDCGTEDDWRSYFDDGYTPQEAVSEDFSYA